MLRTILPTRTIGVRFAVILPTARTGFKPSAEVVAELFPALENVKPTELAGATNFGKRSYFVGKTNKKNWPVYVKYQHETAYTWIRRIKGDTAQFKADLLKNLPKNMAQHVKLQTTSNKIVIKGTHKTTLNKLFNKYL
ncbi:hypothetical protein BABINDRAFT_163305 [Babjeviella inositovora NRRL Y-12698]|uniref:Large ribosomal subunit protein mL49 n=1 Tax=Babjeviella inositovora NRRL Y-12698 TaxID=984486 RepID=A0A1E3QIY5_9ASCO|nr:uncharacterized protein BABINDRAFT_163305 [Babjeviella inositovora NRRL Y-12698]ODQ77568.1 hypothetical protein BABINDRAFT_163305 [Babjeviella inositovora NRRL Y-12698]